MARLRRTAGVARERWEDTALLIFLAGWSAALLGWLLLEAKRSHSVFSGGEGPFAADQLQYLAWVRESGRHFLAGDLFTIPPGHRVFLHPMFLLSGLFVRLGIGIAYSLVPWKVVAVIVLWYATTKYLRRLLPDRLSRFAAFLVALFYASPVVPALAVIHANGLANKTLRIAGEMFIAPTLWTSLPTAIAIALSLSYLLTIERVATTGHRSWMSVVQPSIVGFLAAWLHPWQGATLVALTGMLIVADRASPRTRRLVLPAAFTAGPLLGYAILGRVDAAWRMAQAANDRPAPSLWLVLVALAPLVALAVLGVRRPGPDLAELALLLWPIATLLTLYVLPSFPQHALEGITIPLAVLAMRGVSRLRRNLVPTLALATVLLTVPGTIYFVRLATDFIRAKHQMQLIGGDESRALAFLASERRSGGVLAPSKIGAAVPAWTGRPSWVGHPSWTPAYDERTKITSELASGTLSTRAAIDLVRRSGATYVLMGCGDGRDLAEVLLPIVISTHRFGCATVYELR
jgi:hypothetical protein